MAVRRGRPQTPAAMSTARSTRAQDDRPDPRAETLRRRHQVGSGRSDRGAWDPERHGSPDGYADDVVDLIDRLAPAPVVLAGHSVSEFVQLAATGHFPSLSAPAEVVAANRAFL